MKRSKGSIITPLGATTKVTSIPAGFLILILIGAGLLMLPWSTAPGEHTTFLTALFTSTTSVCVTGSIVVDTCVHWSLFGKIVILGLIQLGGLGVITAVVFLMYFTRRTFSLGDMLVLKELFTLDSTLEILQFFRKVFLGTLIVEIAGAILYMPAFCPQYGLVRGVWYSFFTAVSAFCNAGISIIRPDSLEGYSDNYLVMVVTMMLIVIGGVGYMVWLDILSIRGKVRNGSSRFRLRYSLRLMGVHARLVLLLTAGLILGGAAVIFALEYSNPGTLGNMPLGQKIFNSFFQSVTARTAGFSTFAQQELTETTSLFTDVLMFIGGSPLGTAGGVKTVTILIVLMNVYAFIRNQEEVVILKRRIPAALIRKATAIVTVQLLVVLVIGGLLMLVSGASMSDAMFETMSAVSTVGLSRDLTPLLNEAGQVLIIIGMFLGRIGPITMLLFFQQSKGRKDDVHYADGNYIVG